MSSLPGGAWRWDSVTDEAIFWACEFTSPHGETRTTKVRDGSDCMFGTPAARAMLRERSIAMGWKVGEWRMLYGLSPSLDDMLADINRKLLQPDQGTVSP